MTNKGRNIIKITNISTALTLEKELCILFSSRITIIIIISCASHLSSTIVFPFLSGIMPQIHGPLPGGLAKPD
jgi:hypothetical protein